MFFDIIFNIHLRQYKPAIPMVNYCFPLKGLKDKLLPWLSKHAIDSS